MKLLYVKNTTSNLMETLLYGELEENTVYYLENIVRRYILTTRKKIKMNRKVKDNVVEILYFLIEQGSVTGYLLREDVL